MQIHHLQLHDFRNYTEESLFLPPGLVLVLGPNAQGKSNLLDRDQAAVVVKLTTIGRTITLSPETSFDVDVNQALNAGIALAAPDGSLYFVFTTGVPLIRKYSAAGALLFERHVEGTELDDTIQGLPI